MCLKEKAYLLTCAIGCATMNLIDNLFYSKGVFAMEKTYELTLDDKDTLTAIGKALSSKTRLEILKLLNTHKLNVNDVAARIGIPASSAAVDIRILASAGLIATELVPGTRGSSKLCYRSTSNVTVNFTTTDTKYLD